MNTTTITPSAELRAALAAAGWKRPVEYFVWGQRLQGDPHGVTILRPSGEKQYIQGPFSAIKAGDQIAIVRYG